MTKHLIVVDCETTGLGPDAHVLEIAAINVNTSDYFYFVPHTMDHQLATASKEALAINRYYERRVWEHMLDQSETRQAWAQLADMLDGNTFGGSNPRFDAALVEKRLDNYNLMPGWKHRLSDISAYACGVLGLDPADPPGLAGVCNIINVKQPDHSALADAEATVECFRELYRRVR